MEPLSSKHTASTSLTRTTARPQERRSRRKSDVYPQQNGSGKTSQRKTLSVTFACGSICPVSPSLTIQKASHNYLTHSTAVRPHPRTNQPAFFNNIVSRYLVAKNGGTLQPSNKTEEGEHNPPASAFVCHALEVGLAALSLSLLGD